MEVGDSRALKKHTFTQFGGGTADPNAFKCNGRRERGLGEKMTERKSKKRGSHRESGRKREMEKKSQIIKQPAEKSKLQAV